MSSKTISRVNPVKVAAKAQTSMPSMKLAELTKDLDNIDFENTRELSTEMGEKWERAKRGRGRPRIGEGAEKVLISMEKRLLLVTDALARRKGLDRSKLVAKAIREMLEREAAQRPK